MAGEIRGFSYNKFWPRARIFQGFAVIFRLAMFLVCCFVLTLHTPADFLEVQEGSSQCEALPTMIYDKQ